VFAPDQPHYTCSQCGGLLLVEQDLDFLRHEFSSPGAFMARFDEIRHDRRYYPFGSGVWQWVDLILPGFPTEHILSLREGHTDLWELPNWFKREIGLPNLYVKLEGQAPSASFKDRGMPVAVSEALRLQAKYPDLGIKFVACASTGDTSASAAKYAAYARDRIGCIIMVAQGKISLAQMYQAIDSGAFVLALQADGFDTCMRVIQEFCANHPEIVLVNSRNAMRIVGQETISLEIFQDLRWKVPDWLVIPIGNAGNGTAQMSAWLLLKELGIIEYLPGIIFAQTKAANTIVRWIRSGFTQYEPGEPASTIASAMNIQSPVSGPRIDHLRPEFDIHAFDVSDEDAAQTRAQFNRAGTGLCPQGAVTMNAVLQARDAGIIQDHQTVVGLSTASNLKFVGSGVQHHKEATADQFANKPIEVAASLAAVEEAVKTLVST